MSILSNPMLLMSGVGLIMVFILPKMTQKMTENMSPEDLAELKQRQANAPKLEMPDISSSLTDWLSPKPSAPNPSAVSCYKK
jgi:hypothetical protein